jgi:hypothetical protein
MLEPFQRALALTHEEIAAAAQRPTLYDLLAQDTDEPSEQPKGESGQPRDLRGSPDDTSEQPATDKKEDSK